MVRSQRRRAFAAFGGRRGLFRGVAGGLVVALLPVGDAGMGSAVAAQAPPAAFVASGVGNAAESRPDVISARITARASGRRVEVEGLRSQTSTSWVNPDGTVTVEAHAAPVRFKDAAGAWQPVDLTLDQAADGSVRARSHPGGLEFGGASTARESEGASIAAGSGRSVMVEWPGKLPRPQVSGADALYADVAPGVDLGFRALRTGFEQFVTIKQRPAGAVSWTVPVTTAGLTARAAADGGVEFVDAGGTVQSRILPATAWDAATYPGTDTPVNTSAVGLSVRQVSPGRALLTITPDAEWLADPVRQFPVTVDPTYASGTIDPSFDTFVQSDITTDQSGSSELRVGTPNSGATVARSFLNFHELPVKGKTIMSASLSLYQTTATTCTASTVNLNRTSTTTNTSTRWSNQPSVGAATWSAAFSKGFTGCAAGRVSIPITDLVQAWSSDSVDVQGLRLSALGESYTAGYKVFSSTETANDPYITYTYSRTPGTASVPQTSSASTWNGQTYLSTTTPTLSSTATDPDGNQVRYSIPVYSDASGSSQVSGCTTGYVASGSAGSCPVTPALTNGSTYYVRALAQDETGLYGPYSSLTASSAKVIVASTPPPAPVVSCPVPYTNGSWQSSAPASAVSCTVTVAGSGVNAVVQAKVSVDGAVGGWVAAAPGSPVTVSVPNTSGGHSIVATARTASGLTTTAASYGFGYGQAGLTQPATGAVSNDVFVISAAAPPATSGSVSAALYWRRSGGSEPGDFSATQGSITGWTAAGITVPVTSTAASASVSNLRWAAASAMQSAGLGRAPALIDVQLCFTYSASGTRTCTWTATASSKVSVVRVPHAFGDGYPTADAGPGQVALWTGEFQASATDVSVPGYTGDLSLSRSQATFDAPADAVNGVFGPGWTASFDGPDAGVADMQVVDATAGDGTVALVDDDGSALVFREPGSGRVLDVTGTYSPVGVDTLLEGSKLAVSVTGTAPNRTWTITYTEDDGTVTTFTRTESGATTVWAPAGVAEPGVTGQTTFSRDGQGRITRILASPPPGVTCPATGALNAGCRALDVVYATTTTATASASGDVAGQVKQVNLLIWNPAKTGGAGMDTITVAAYKYDVATRLAEVSDPRNGLTTTYTYTGTNGSQTDPVRLASIKPPGQARIYFDYDTSNVPVGLGLRRVRRDPADGSAGTPVTLATFVYGVPTSGAGLPTVNSATTNWGQGKNPTYGAAVFGADKVPGSLDPASVPSGDWSYADLQYTDELGYTVNTASYGAGAWQVTSATYDDQGNVIRALDAGGVKAATADPTHADNYATITRYNPDIKNGSGVVLTPAGTLVTDEWGPAREATLNDWTDQWVRPHTHTDYDQGAPNSGINPATSAPYRLPTKVTVGVADTTAATTDPSVTLPADRETISRTFTGYSVANSPVTGDPDTWALSLPTTQTTDLDASNSVTSADITTTTRYDSEGKTIESRQPASSGTDAGTVKTVYYRAGTGSGDVACDSKPQWAGLACRTYPAAAPDSGPTMPDSRTTGYNYLLAPTTVVETSGATTRTTTTTYLADGRVDTVTTTASGLTGSTAVPTTTNTYDPATGLQTKTSTSGTDYTQTGYDAWGRPTSYRNSLGETTTTSYVPIGSAGAGSVATVTDPKGTTTYGYGADATGAIERRGVPTSVTVSGVGTFTGAYDPDGALVRQDMPGGIRQDTSYDTAGEPVGLSYTGDVTDPDTGAVTTGTWLSWTQTNDATGRVRREWTPAGAVYTDPVHGGDAYDRGYGYDAAGRLVVTYDRTSTTGDLPADPDTPGTLTAACTSRSYAFDKNGNRTIYAAYPAAADGSCQTSTGATSTRFYGYDTADRNTVATGYGYDTFGRTTTIPTADAPTTGTSGGGALTLGYYDTDAARTITQNGTTSTYTLDPTGRRLVATTAPTGGGTATATMTRHYTDDSDNPGWVSDTTTGVTTRYASSLGGDLNAQTVTWLGVTNIQLSLSTLHGDSVATAYLPTGGGHTQSIDAWSDYTEYGTPRDPAAAHAISGQTGYGWLGTKERATEPGTGLTLMGDRLYNPTTGRFTTTDPEPGGNTNAYNYPNDPINMYDLDGHWLRRAGRWAWKHRWGIASGVVMGGCLVVSAGACAIAGGAYAAAHAYHNYRSGSRHWKRDLAADVAGIGGGFVAGRGFGWFASRSSRAGRWGFRKYLRRSAIAYRSRGRHAYRRRVIHWRRTTRNVGWNAVGGVAGYGASYSVSHHDW
jgi:RHS repeat-associated protein